MVSVGLANIQSRLNQRLDQHTTLAQCHEVVNCSVSYPPVNELVDQMQIAAPCALIASILQ